MDLTHGKLQLERGHIDEAAGVFMQALSENFNDPEALFLLASCFMAKDQPGAAANLYKSCLDIEKMPEAFQNLGGCYKQVNKTAEAEQIWEMGSALAKTPRMLSQFYANIAGCYVNNGTPEIALKHYEKALQADPSNLAIQFNMGLCYLEMGNWKEGFGRYDMGFPAGNREYRMYEGVKPYRGGGVDEIKGKTVIVWGDQGIGDEIMFASCLPDLIKDAKRVIFDCHPRLVRLFQEAFGIECHGTRKTQQMDWHLQSGAEMSIPLTTLATIYRSDGQFSGEPYLKAKSSRFARDGIGISWTGGIAQTRKDLRSIPLDKLKSLLSFNGDWYSLQYTATASDEVARFEEQSGIHIKHYPGMVQCDDYAVTAEFVASKRAIVTVCTSVVHLAGALGVPCFCLVPSKPAWRYGISGNEMPWYSSVKLYRQEGDDWSSAIYNLMEDIHAYL